jgi:hypothetical protein
MPSDPFAPDALRAVFSRFFPDVGAFRADPYYGGHINHT